MKDILISDVHGSVHHKGEHVLKDTGTTVDLHIGVHCVALFNCTVIAVHSDSSIVNACFI